ncbi:MAG: glycosyltransferase family 4 protein [Chloroflexota bacterium]
MSQTTNHNPHIFWVQTDALGEFLASGSFLGTVPVLRREGWRVTLVSEGEHGEDGIVNGVPVLEIARPDIYFLGQVIFHWRVMMWLHRNWDDVDIVLLHEMSAVWLFLMRLIGFIRPNRPLFVMDTRTLPMIAEENRSLKDVLRDAYYATIEHTASWWLDGQLAITERMAEAVHVKPEMLWGMWPSGVEAEKFVTAYENRDWSTMENGIRLVYVGSLTRERNLLALCEAVSKAREEDMLFEFHMVGGGTALDELKAYAAQTDGHIIVDDPIPHDEIPQVLADAHLGVLVFPDELRFQVSSPIKLFEYQAAGLPIFASSIACHTDVVGGDNYAIWADETDVDGLVVALRDTWAKREQLPQMGEEAYAATDNWTWAASARKLGRALQAGLEKYVPVQQTQYQAMEDSQ